MHELSIREMRAALGNLDRLADESGELIVTRHGQAIARILPIKSRKPRPSHADLRNRTPRLVISSAELIRSERDER